MVDTLPVPPQVRLTVRCYIFLVHPIPLTSPSGAIYAYACGSCHRVAAPERFGSPLGPARVANVADLSREDAERCCTCTRCRAPRLLAGTGLCDTCRETLEAEFTNTREEAAFERRRVDDIEAASLARSPNPAAAELLRIRMSDVSQSAWAAGWLVDLEFLLWSMLVDDDTRSFGRIEVTDAELTRLRSLAQMAGGWWHCSCDDDTRACVFVPTAEWQEIYRAERANARRRHAEAYVDDET